MSNNKPMDDGAMWAVGTMSGTSLDGVDVAVIKTDGKSIQAFGKGGTRAYDADQRAKLCRVLGRWPASGADPLIDAAHEVLLQVHAELLAPLHAGQVVGFHGQTLAHDPAGRGTHQLGDGARLARMLGRTVVWDFRSADVAAGGQGAPLAPFFHFACAKWIGAQQPLAILNLGGVANITWIDPACADPETPGALLAFDTGPANAPLDDLMRASRGMPCDFDGQVAARGHVDRGLVDDFLGHPWFAREPPKSLDRNAFALALDQVLRLNDADAAATLTAIIAACVRGAFRHLPTPPERLLVTGGGRRNSTLMRMISDEVACAVATIEAAGLDGDLLEAQAFAHLAVRVLRGMPTSAPSTTGVALPTSGGVISTS